MKERKKTIDSKHLAASLRRGGLMNLLVATTLVSLHTWHAVGGR